MMDRNIRSRFSIFLSPMFLSGNGFIMSMMFNTMQEAGLLPPVYSSRPSLEREAVSVSLWNQNRPNIWEQVSARIDEKGTITRYGQRLAAEVRHWGQWIKERAEQELAEFYPKDSDGYVPIAYRFGLTPNLNQILVTRRGAVKEPEIEERVKQQIEKLFGEGPKGTRPGAKRTRPVRG
jgi:hypothetical protein